MMIPCGADDAKELAGMARSIWMDYYPPIIGADDTEFILKTFQSEEAIRQQMRDGHLYYFITEGEEKAGYLCIVPEGDSLLLSKIYVAERFRGKGLGSETMEEVLEKGRELKMRCIYLRVNRQNLASIGFYKSKGFMIAKEEKKEIGGGCCMDDFLMEYCF